LSKEVDPPEQRSFDTKKDKHVSKKQSIVRETAPQKKPGVSASIDLHGFTQEKARQHLLLALRRLQENRSKCVLVITGKGTRGLIETGTPGRLRLALTQWILQEDFKEIVREISPAKQAHGGQGAFYVWVRAKK
jgi:DNA-nicking Smr family endonuclease